jgi:hypothetical protein
MKPREVLIILALAAGAILVHGYHFGIEDAATYVPGIKAALNPALYHFDRELFLSQTRPMLFCETIALSARILPLPLEWVIFLWHFFFVSLMMYACLRISRFLFKEAASQWAGVVLVAALLTLPIAGTRLFILDQYLHPRTLATAFILLAISNLFENRLKLTLLWFIISAPMHPQMTAFGLAHLLFLGIRKPLPDFSPGYAASFISPLTRLFEPPPDAWKEAMATRTHHMLRNWMWYEWMGIFAPFLLLRLFQTAARNTGNQNLEFVCRRVLACGIFFLVVAGVVSSIPALERFATLQPMRGLQLLYVLLLLSGGGLIARFVLHHSSIRWLIFFIPICTGMFLAQRALFPQSRHLEFPFRDPGNRWVEAFLWTKTNTPANAVFALDSYYMLRNGEDNHGFRALAERSALADRVKDAGVAALFPHIAPTWQKQVHDLDGWDQFGKADFRRLSERYGISWIILENSHPAVGAFDCPYRNGLVSVCRLP